MSNRMVFVNLPVKDLDRAKQFYTALGYRMDERFSDENAASFMISDQIVVMVLVESFFETFTDKRVADSNTSSEVMVALSAESKDEIDTTLKKAIAAGAVETTSQGDQPEMDPDLMYSRSFDDPDGHRWEYVWMDMSKVPETT